jgi:uncharacterized protein
MKNIIDKEKTSVIEYPCQWQYKIIGPDEEEIKKNILEIVKEKEHKISYSNNSKGGKYYSYNLELSVASQEERDNLYLELKNNKAVKLVL